MMEDAEGRVCASVSSLKPQFVWIISLHSFSFGKMSMKLCSNLQQKMILALLYSFIFQLSLEFKIKVILKSC